MRQSFNEIVIHAAPERIMELAFDLPRWPEFLPHYRWVRVLEQEGERLTVEMACRRGVIPLKWRSHLWVDRTNRRMRFHHVVGPARGMDVEWTLEPEGEDVRVTIRHDLTLKTPIIRSAPGCWIVSEVFVSAVAGRTLACLKAAAEGQGGT